MRETRNNNKMLVIKSGEKIPLVRQRQMWEDNIKIHGRGNGCEDVKWNEAVRYLLKFRHHWLCSQTLCHSVSNMNRQMFELEYL